MITQFKQIQMNRKSPSPLSPLSPLSSLPSLSSLSPFPVQIEIFNQLSECFECRAPKTSKQNTATKKPRRKGNRDSAEVSLASEHCCIAITMNRHEWF